MVTLIETEPKKTEYSRSADSWGQVNEEDFLKFYMPIQAHVRKWNLEKMLRNYAKSTHYRVNWYKDADPEKLRAIAYELMMNKPKVESVVVKKPGARNGSTKTIWYVTLRDEGTFVINDAERSTRPKKIEYPIN